MLGRLADLQWIQAECPTDGDALSVECPRDIGPVVQRFENDDDAILALLDGVNEVLLRTE